MDGGEAAILLTLRDIGPRRCWAHLAYHICTGIPAAVGRFKERHIVWSRAHVATPIGAALHAFPTGGVIAAQLHTHTKSTRHGADGLQLHLRSSRTIVYREKDVHGGAVHNYSDAVHYRHLGKLASVLDRRHQRLLSQTLCPHTKRNPLRPTPGLGRNCRHPHTEAHRFQ